MNKYLKLKIDYLKADTSLEFDIFVYLPSKNKYLKYLSKGSLIPKSKIEAFKTLNYSKVNQLFINESEALEFQNNNPLLDLSQLIDGDYTKPEIENNKFDNNFDDVVEDAKKFSNTETANEPEQEFFSNNDEFNENPEDKVTINDAQFEEPVKSYSNKFKDEEEAEELDIDEEEELENLIKNENTSDDEKCIVIDRILKTKNPETIKKFSNVIKSNVSFYKFNQLDEFLKKAENIDEFTEKEVIEAMEKFKETKITDLDLMDSFFPKIKSMFDSLNEQKAQGIEKTLFDFSEFALNSLQIHDTENDTVFLSKKIDEICNLLSEKLEHIDALLYHSISVSILATSIGVLLETNDSKLLKDLCISGLLHDIGFMKLGTDCFNKFIKTQNPSPEQFEIFKKHPIEAYNIVSKLPKVSLLSDIVVRVILEHHEHPRGYPNQKSIITKTMQVKIISISDKIAYKIQNNTFTNFKNELGNLLDFQSKLDYKMFDIKLIKQIMQKV